MKTSGSVNQNAIPAANRVMWFKPRNQPVGLYFINDKNKEGAHIEFSSEVSTIVRCGKFMTEEMFFHECGYVLRHEIINDERTLFLLSMALQELNLNGIEVAPPICRKQTPAEIIAADILRRNPRISEKCFAIEAELVGDRRGFSEGDILEAIVNYA